MAVPKILEKAMRDGVDRWLRGRDLTVFHEVRLGWQADAIGVAFYQPVGKAQPDLRRLVAVEMKLSDVKRAFEQALVYSKHATESWVCIPAERWETMSPSQVIPFQADGIGLLLWEPTKDGRAYGGTCTVKIQGDSFAGPERSLQAKLWAKCRAKAKAIGGPTCFPQARRWKEAQTERAREYRKERRERLKRMFDGGK